MAATPLTADDLFRFRWIDTPRLSPDASRVVWQEGRADAEARENRSVLWVAGRDGGNAWRLTEEDGRSRGPEWSPDGARLCYVAKQGAADQLFVIPAAPDGEAVQLTDLPDGVQAASWSPDGGRLAFLALVPSDPDGVIEDPRPPDDPTQGRRPPVARVVRAADYKHDGKGYTDGRRTHLFVVAADGGEPRQVTSGAWDVGAFDWSPDGRRLALIGDPEPGADLRMTRPLAVVDVAGGAPAPLVEGKMAGSPAWSPDGRLIAFLATDEPGVGFFDRVWVVPAGGGEARCLTPSLDRDAGSSPVSDMRGHGDARLIWDARGGRIWFTAAGPGVSSVLSVDLEGDVREEMAPPRAVVAAYDVRAGVVAAVVADPLQPGDLVVVEGDGERRVTDANAWLRERWVGIPEAHRFTAPDGLEVEGWLLQPPDFDPARRYPLVLQIHGGPHGEYGWPLFHEFQVLAGLGFLVLYTNPRGSTGYGQRFCRACVLDWGGADYQDLMSALDQLIERTGFVDTERLGVAGGSYGGFMTNWIVGHTDRFRAAVSMRSISNLVSVYAQDDIVAWCREEMGTPPWPDSDRLWQGSPIRYAREMRTPLLLIHSEMDLRCPISQAEELFGALRVLGREVEMVRFPGESHDLSRNGRPDRRVERLNRIAGWFTRHLAGAGEPGVTPATVADPGE